MNLEKGFALFLLLIPAVLVILPLLLLLSGSLMDIWELSGYLKAMFSDGNEFISWKLMPDYPSFANYKKLLFETPQFFVLFW
ncbi:MAG: carbohydrate ABC transporter permease, partial [Lachnospiraceae bacterium]|nr:carbohydrate ABC transporter permease [Lachnospiraceae bacterium]